MANKNVTIKKRNASNTGWDELYPVTTAENVKCGDGSSVGAQLADIAYKPAGGTANDITVTKQGFTLTDGQYVEFKASANNTNDMTIKANDEAIKSLRNEDGEQLASGDIEENKFYKAIYISDKDFFQLAPRGGAKINGIIKQYVVQSGQNINAGDFVRFVNDLSEVSSHSKILENVANIQRVTGTKSRTSAAITAIPISSKRVIVVYTTTVSPNTLLGRILILNDDTITMGNSIVLGLTRTGGSLVAGINVTPSVSVLLYENQSDGASGGIRINHSTQDTSTTLSVSSFTPSLTSRISMPVKLVTLSSSRVIAFYNDSNVILNSVLIDVGSKLSFSTHTTIVPRQFNGGLDAVLVDTNKIVITYNDNRSGGDGSVCAVVNVSGNTVTRHTATQFSSLNTNLHRIVLSKVNATRVLYCNTDAGSSSPMGTIGFLDIDVSNNITITNSMVFTDLSIYYGLNMLDTGLYAVFYGKLNIPQRFNRFRLIKISGNTIAVMEERLYNTYSNTLNYSLPVRVSTNQVAIVSAEELSDGAITMQFMRVVPQIHGVAKENGNGGQTIEVYTI